MPIDPTTCGGCPLHDSPAGARDGRREFLRQLAAAVASLGIAAAAPLHAQMPLVGGVGDRRSERRFAIPAADGVSIDRDESLILARAAGRVYAFSLACPHQNTALRWDAGDGEFRCPKHKSRYRPDGSFIDGRATRAMDRLAIRRDGDAIVVDVDVLYQQDEQPAAWAAAFVAL